MFGLVSKSTMRSECIIDETKRVKETSHSRTESLGGKMSLFWPIRSHVSFSSHCSRTPKKAIAIELACHDFICRLDRSSAPQFNEWACGECPFVRLKRVETRASPWWLSRARWPRKELYLLTYPLLLICLDIIWAIQTRWTQKIQDCPAEAMALVICYNFFSHGRFTDADFIAKQTDKTSFLSLANQYDLASNIYSQLLSLLT